MKKIVLKYSIKSMTPKRNMDKLDLKFKIFCFAKAFVKRIKRGTSLVVQWLRIYVSTSGPWVWSISWELRSHPHAVQSKKLNKYFLKKRIKRQATEWGKKIFFQVTKLTKDFLSRVHKEHLRIRKHPFFSMCKTFEHRIHCGR